MIQRIQSIWLLLAACCMAVCFMTPVARYQLDLPQQGQHVSGELNLIAKDSPDMMNQIINMEQEVEFGQKMSGFNPWMLVVIALLVMAISLVAIFMYRNRVRQMRVVAVGFLLNVVYVFLVFFWAVDSYADKMAQVMGGGEADISWMVGAYAPLLSIVLLVLAHRSIKKDEAKVRAADRLR